MNNPKIKITLLIILILALAGAAYLLWPRASIAPTPTACTQDAKLCPDGTTVGRTGPNCEFTQCPTNTKQKIFNDQAKGVTYSYPAELGTSYISTVDWPPAVQAIKEIFSCQPAGNEIARGGRTDQEIINGNTYCVTKESEGAAGSIYTNYAYAFEKGDKTIILTFSLRFVQCMNYDEPKATECETERNTFNINGVVDAIAQSLKLI